MTNSAIPQSPVMIDGLRYECSGCETLVPAADTCCSYCQLARPPKLIVSNADLVDLIVKSGIAVFSVDIEFIEVLQMQRKLPMQVPVSNVAVESPAKSNVKQSKQQNTFTRSKQTTLSKNNKNDNNNDSKNNNKNDNKNDNAPRSVRRLRDHMLPGLHALAPEPAVYSNLTVSAKMEQACSILQTDLIQYVKQHSPEYAHEMILPDTTGKDHEACMAGVPYRIEPGYYKAHLSSNFVTENFGDSCLPHGIRVKKRANQKAIAFFSTTVETLSNTHYDQDPSFLFVLKGMKQIMYARPSIAKMYEKARIVESHSSIFEGLNPFEDQGSGWEYMTLTSGDGLLLPQNWLHSVKSSPGTLAISFQVESTGDVRLEPVFKKRKRQTSNPLLLLNPTIPRKRRKSSRAVFATPIKKLVTESPKVKRQFVQSAIITRNAVPSPVHMMPCQKIIQIQKQRYQPPVYPGFRKSNRAKMLCGNDNCQNSFLTCGLMWMLIRKDTNWGTKVLASHHPVVPKSNPKHLICFDCVPQNGQELLCTSKVFNRYDKRKLKEWQHYVFCAASRGDYIAQTGKVKVS